MHDDTTNQLTDFDFCLALPQKVINDQIRKGWDEWLTRSTVAKGGVFELFPKDASGRVSKFGLRAKLGPLSVSLNVANGRGAQVGVTLPLESGEVTYWDEEAEEKASVQVGGWKMRFLANLSRRGESVATLAGRSKAAGDAAKKAILGSGGHPNDFSIESLLMDFTNMETKVRGNSNLQRPADVPALAAQRAEYCLYKLLPERAGPFMLGTFVSQQRRTGASTFALTGHDFHVKADGHNPAAATLSYLGMFSGRRLPGANALHRLRDSWLDPGALHRGGGCGVMAISRTTLLDRYLIPKFTASLGVAPVRQGHSWTFNGSHASSYKSKDIIKRYHKTGYTYSLTISVRPGTNTLAITGRIASYYTYDGVTLDMGFLGGNDTTEWIRYRGHRDIRASVVLTGSGGAKGFGLRSDIPESNYFGGVVMDERTVGGFAKVTQALGDAGKALQLTGKTPNDIVDSAMRRQLEGVRKGINHCLKRIDLRINQSTFIPPGGGEFDFGNVRFSNAADLLFDASFKS